MTNKKSTKRALLSSALALIVCIAMLVGTTFAWFTDSVTSNGNIIKAGELQVGMYWAEGDLDPATVTDWTDASKGAIFNSTLWEPGYTEAKHLKVVNEGNLALKYQLRILANGIVSELADVIDVYYFGEAAALTRASLTEAKKLGTLSEVLNYGSDEALNKTVNGSLEKGESDMITLALKMKESAGNEYQGLSIGTDFSVQLIATQQVSEYDSFGNEYDKRANYPAQDMPSAMVFKLTGDELNIYDAITAKELTLDAGYQFLPTEDGDVVDKESPYKNWHADFVVSADNDVPANSMMLAGYYKLYDDYLNRDHEGDWVGITSDEIVKAGTELRLVQNLAEINYSMVCNFGNDGIGFLCGVKDLDGSNEGTTITVRLRIYEVDNGGNETGKYIDTGIFEYTFGGDYETADNGAVYFNADDGDIELYSAKNVDEENFVIPDGVTDIGASAFGGNTKTKNVVFPETVTSIGYQAFKGSAVESVTLNEGLTEIADYAFNNAKELSNFNIPSTVTSIGKNAFRLTAASEVTVPANVKTVVEGAFRDMANLTTVTVEGNVAFEKFVFRSCPKLETICLLGDDVTFASGQFATRKDTGDATGITIYVKNSTVAARLMAAQPTGGYEVKILGEEADGTDASDVVLAKNDTEFGTAISEGAQTVILSAGNYKIPTAVAGKEVEISGTKDVKLTLTEGVTAAGSNITFSGITVEGDDEDGNWYTTQLNGAAKATYKDCTITGRITTYCNSEFINCTFINTFNNDYSVYCYSGKNISFEGCSFDTQCSKAVKVYDEGNGGRTVTLNKCNFKSATQKKAGVEIDSTYSTYYVYINNCTLEGKYTALWNSDAGEDKGTNVCVDGTWVKGSAPAN